VELSRFIGDDRMDAKIDSSLTDRLDDAIDSAIARRKIVGTVVIVARHGEVAYARAAGLADREAGQAMAMDAIFRLASVTKPLVAATALAMVDAGLLGLDDPVSEHLPYFTPKLADGTPAEVLVRHLITHTSGLSYDREALAAVEASSGMSGPILPLAENVRRLGQMPLKFVPGTRWLYSTAIDVLGCVVATINGSSLEDAVHRYVTGPLGMEDTRFGVADLSRLAVPYGDGKPEPVRMADTTFLPERNGGAGGTTFCPSRIFNPLAPQSGGAGMAGTAPDFIRFLEMVRSGGGKVLRPETVAAARQNQIGDVPMDGDGRGGERFGFLGAVVDDPAAAATPAARGTILWGGVYGHNWFIDPDAGLSVASFSNTAVEGCNGPFREEIRDAVYGRSA
jgi:CubicO group peptidase (beta-lactamase class C family)